MTSTVGDEKNRSRPSGSLDRKANRRMWVILFLLGLLLFTIHRNSGGAERTTTKNDHSSWTSSRSTSLYMQRWLDFQRNHAFEVEDRFSFAEMAFRTSTYADIICDWSSMEEKQLQHVERELYPWMNDLHLIRRRHVHQRLAGSNETDESGWRIKGPSNEARSPKGVARGIVIAAGNKQFKYTTQLIATIRHGLKSSIPIEVYYYGQDDLTQSRQEFLTSHYQDVQTVDLSTVGLFNESFVGLKDGTWAMKPYAMLATNFTEVMLLDADSILLTDPDDFFVEPGYTATGTLFFHDRLMRMLKYPLLHTFLREQLGERKASVHMRDSLFWLEGLRHRQESGLVVLNKSDPNVFASLLFTLWQNAKSVRESVTYNIFYGDKETFWLSHELANLPYHFSRYWAGAIGPEESAHSEGFCSDHILHFFDSPYAHPPNFEHSLYAQAWKRGRPAWMNGSLRSNKLYDSSETVFDYKKSIWSMDGSWEWHAIDDKGAATCCMVDYTRWSMDELNMGDSLPDLFAAGQNALEETEAFLSGAAEHQSKSPIS